ncbi:MAG: mechanosensitive ion channel [Phycisphaerae bacterium]|nr:mechanosensitive ion channel [Phycisphaerae bacterium]
MTELWNTIAKFVEQYLSISPQLLAKLLWTLLVLLGYFLIRKLVIGLTGRRIKDVARKYIASKTISYLLGAVALVALVRIWLGGAAGLATYLGLVSAGVAIALQDPLSNLAGWVYILASKPFTTGDRIQIGDRAGDVIDIRLFQFTVNEIGNWVNADQSTGRIIHVPNNRIWKDPCANYTQGFNFIWNEVAITITFESNWRKAKDILTRIAGEQSIIKSEHAAAQIRGAAQKFLIHYENLTPIVWTSVAASGVTLTARYLCAPRRRRSSSGRIWEAVLVEFAACEDIDFAYPTQRFYNNLAEGKPGARADAPQQGDQPSH